LVERVVSRHGRSDPCWAYAWVVGDEPFVALEFESKTAETYAKS
jgi:hypothetical protein